MPGSSDYHVFKNLKFLFHWKFYVLNKKNRYFSVISFFIYYLTMSISL